MKLISIWHYRLCVCVCLCECVPSCDQTLNLMEDNNISVIASYLRIFSFRFKEPMMLFLLLESFFSFFLCA